MKPIAEFDGYMGDLAVIKWTGETRLSVGAKMYALPVLDAAPVLPGDDAYSRVFGLLPVQAQPVATVGLRALYMAVIDCGHRITDDELTLHRDPSKEGNVLGQLADRLALAVTQPAPVAQPKASDLHNALRRMTREYIATRARQDGKKIGGDWSEYEDIECVRNARAALAATQPAAALADEGSSNAP